MIRGNIVYRGYRAPIHINYEWVTPSDLGTYWSTMDLSIQFQCNPSDRIVRYSLVGEYPEYFEFSDSGLLTGTVNVESGSENIDFTVRARGINGTYSDKIFTIEVRELKTEVEWISPDTGDLGEVGYGQMIYIPFKVESTLV